MPNIFSSLKKKKVKSLSHVRLFATPWTVTYQGPLSIGFFRKESRSGLPFPSAAIKYKVSEGSEVKSFSGVQLFATPWTVTYQAPLSMDFPGNSTGMDGHFLLQQIFPTQESNPGLPHCRQTLYHLSHPGSP